MAITTGTPISLLPAPTADIALNKDDVLAALGAAPAASLAAKANLTGGNIISGPQQNSGIVTSSAALSIDPTQLPNQAQVRAITSPAYVDPLVDWHFGGWSGSGALASRGFKAGVDLTLIGNPTETNSSLGIARSFNGMTMWAESNAVARTTFDRINNGEHFTLLLDGDFPSTTYPVETPIIGSHIIGKHTPRGFLCFYGYNVNSVSFAYFTNPSTIIGTISLFGFGAINKILIFGQITNGVTFRIYNSSGAMRETQIGSGVPFDQPSDIAPYILRSTSSPPQWNQAIASGSFRRIRLYDRVLDI
jgi:hypothetical protein